MWGEEVVVRVDRGATVKDRRAKLELELDYELASLYLAMQDGNVAEIEKCKESLAEITKCIRNLT